MMTEENNTNGSTANDSGHLLLNGEVISVARDKFSIQLDDSESVVIAQLSGKMRINKIRVLLGDRVEVKVSPYDLTRGFIVGRK